MGTRRDLLAIQTIVVTFAAAVRSIAKSQPDSDVRVLLAEQCRDRALQLLDAAEANIPYLPDSPLDHAIRDGRRRIENTRLARD